MPIWSGEFSTNTNDKWQSKEEKVSIELFIQASNQIDVIQHIKIPYHKVSITTRMSHVFFTCFSIGIKIHSIFDVFFLSVVLKIQIDVEWLLLRE